MITIDLVRSVGTWENSYLLTHIAQNILMSSPSVITPAQALSASLLQDDQAGLSSRFAEILLSLCKRKVGADVDIHRELAAITEASAETLQGEGATIWLLSEDRTRLLCVDCFSHSTHAHDQGPEISFSGDIQSYFAKLSRSRTVILNQEGISARAFFRTMIMSPACKSMLSTAVWSNGEAVGALILEHGAEEKQWTCEEQLFFASIADLGGSVILASEHLRLEAQIQHAQKIEGLGLLSGAFAHDLNNLLMSIIGGAGMLLKEASESSKSRTRIERIKGAAQMAGELASQLRRYLGKDKYVVEPVRINSLVDEMKLLLETAVSKKANLEVEMSPNLPSVAADAAQIRQMVLNLVTNASDALENKEGKITVKSGVAAVDAAYLAGCFNSQDLCAGDYVFLEVSDTGKGIEEEIQKKIFNPFFSTKNSGRGLGLAGVLGIVRTHGGALRVNSQVGKGTTFTVLLPVIEQVHSENNPGKKLILVVDDQILILELAQEILTGCGFEVITSQSGEEALDLYRQNAPLLRGVVLDVTLPGQSGLETFEKMKQLNTDIPILLTSGYGEQDLADSSKLPASYAGYIQKPFLPSELVDKVKKATD
jgi:signal transduction histidine kinase